MKCLIVTNAYIKNKSQILQANRIAEELRKLGTDCKIVKNIHLAQIKDGATIAEPCDFCVFLDKDRAAARLLEKGGIRLFNRAEGMEVCDDKMRTHIMLSNCGIPMPDSVYAPLCYDAHAEISDEFLEGVAQRLSFPMVAKICYGSLGAGVFLIGDRSELFTFEQNHKLLPHFYQKFIGSGGEDIRVIVIGGKVVCSMRRVNANDFRSNIELGGHGEPYDADPCLKALCEKTAELLHLDYCGIDVLTDGEGRRYVCEVNSNAFFAEAERVCAVNVAKEFAVHVLAEISKGQTPIKSEN